MKKAALILLAAIVAASGCVSNSTTQNPDKANSTQNKDNSLIGGDSVTTFTAGGENMTMTVKAYNNSETYDLTIKQRSKVTGNQYFSKYQAVNLSARIMCGLAQQIAYNYTAISNNGESSGLGSNNKLSEGLGTSENSEDSQIPKWVLQDFEAKQVKYTLLDKGSSEVVASCRPTEENLNLDIKIEQNSANSEGLS